MFFFSTEDILQQILSLSTESSQALNNVGTKNECHSVHTHLSIISVHTKYQHIYMTTRTFMPSSQCLSVVKQMYIAYLIMTH